jgi:sec-independent protein translocase protein TatB
VFGIGWTEFVVIAIVLLIFVGPRHLPGMFRKVGQIIGELKNASRELRNQVSTEVREIENDLKEAVSPRDLVDEVKGKLDFEVGSPYAAIHRGEKALKKEIDSIKKDIEKDDGQLDAKGRPRTGDGEPVAVTGERPKKDSA